MTISVKGLKAKTKFEQIFLFFSFVGLPVIGASSQFSKINGVEKYVSIGNDVTTRVGENVALYCMAVGEPPLSISVFRNGVPLRQYGLTSTSSILV